MTAPEAAASAEDYRKVLWKVGVVLIAVGLLDIVWMVYCLTRWLSYSSCFNIFAVIAGVLLVRASLPAARVVALFSAFFLTGFVGTVLLFPVTMRLPLELALLYLRLRPLAVVGSVVALGALLVLLAWAYRMLTKPVVLAAMDHRQIDHRRWRHRPSSGFIAGALLLVIVFGAVGFGFRRTGEQAKERAARELGPGYHLFVSSVSTSSAMGSPTMVRAEVVAYNNHEFKTVAVEFER